MPVVKEDSEDSESFSELSFIFGFHISVYLGISFNSIFMLISILGSRNILSSYLENILSTSLFILLYPPSLLSPEIIEMWLPWQGFVPKWTRNNRTEKSFDEIPEKRKNFKVFFQTFIFWNSIFGFVKNGRVNKNGMYVFFWGGFV